jgi:hypothetical protein
MRGCAGILELSELHRCQHAIDATEPGKLVIAAIEQKRMAGLCTRSHRMQLLNGFSRRSPCPASRLRDSLTDFKFRLRKRPEWFKQ